jgi:hypothetical protein
MLNFKLLRLIFLCSLFASHFIAYAQKDWEEAKEKDGIKVFVLKKNKSKIKEFKVTGTVHSSLSGVKALFMDPSHISNWMAGINQSKILNKMDDESIYMHLVFHIMFPLKNKDIIYHQKISQEKKYKALFIIYKSVPDYKPEESGLVRMIESEVTWKFLPLGNGNLEVTYKCSVDLDGIPEVEMQQYVVDNPLKTLKNLQEELLKEPYKSAKLNGIKE